MAVTRAQKQPQFVLPALLRAGVDAFRIPDLRNRILFTLAILVVFRFIAHVPVPGVDRIALDSLLANNPIFGIFDIFSGGALRNLSIAAIGVYPYITASIILQVLTPFVPHLRGLSQEGEIGRKAISRYTHYLTFPLAILQAYGQLNLFGGAFGGGAIEGFGFGGGDTFSTISILLSMAAGTMLLVWLGELVTEKGIGNGISLIIFAGIVSTLPQVAIQLWGLRSDVFELATLIIIGLLIVYLVVLFNEAQRRVPVHYGRSVFRGGRMYRQTGASYIPLRVNSAGVIPLIFAFALLTLPSVFASYFQDPFSDSFISTAAFWFTNNFGPGALISGWFSPYWIAVFVLAVLFTFFYTIIVHNQQNLAENLQRNGGFVPGIRPGKPTNEFLMRVIFRITWGGALFLGFVAVIPWVAQVITQLPNATSLIQSTSLLIVVGVVLDTMRQLEAQLLMRNYDGFIR